MYEILTDSRLQQFTKEVRERDLPSQRRRLIQLRELELIRRRPEAAQDQPARGRWGATVLARIGARLAVR